MKYYQEISILPNSDVNTYFLWKKLYQQIHIALADNKGLEKKSKIGLSFPEYNEAEHYLGTKLRLFAQDEEYLQQFHCERWLARLSDYVHVGQIKPVPEKISGHACFRNIKLKGNKEKLARRRARRKGESLEQALEHLDGFEEQRSKLPYINMVSETNGQRFRLFIKKKIMDGSEAGFYSCYGLSNTTTVPLF